jgi:hypothetical protein
MQSVNHSIKVSDSSKFDRLSKPLFHAQLDNRARTVNQVAWLVCKLNMLMAGKQASECLVCFMSENKKDLGAKHT